MVAAGEQRAGDPLDQARLILEETRPAGAAEHGQPGTEDAVKQHAFRMPFRQLRPQRGGGGPSGGCPG